MSKRQRDKFTTPVAPQKLRPDKSFIQVSGAETTRLHPPPFKQVVAGFDFDGTLSNGNDHSISQELQDYLIRLDKLGVKIFFASGRNLDFLRKIAKKINVIPFIIVAENGGHIWNQKTGEHLFGGTEDFEKFRSQVDKIECSDYEDELKYSIWTRCYSLESAGEAAAKIQNLVINNGWNLKVFLHPSGCVDVVPTGITKSNVSLFLTQAKYDIHYFGDGFNDLSLMMLDSVTPHTVANGKEEVKYLVRKKGGLVSTKKYGEGVVELIKTLWSI